MDKEVFNSEINIETDSESDWKNQNPKRESNNKDVSLADLSTEILDSNIVEINSVNNDISNH